MSVGGSSFLWMRISDQPAHERPRERLWREGPAVLAGRELVALLLGSGGRGGNALALADELLVSRGGLDGLARSLPEEVASVPGVGAAKAAALVAAFELARRAASGSQQDSPILRKPEDLAAVVEPDLRDARREIVLALILDAAHRLRRVVRISEGSVDQALLPARDVLNAVLRNDGVAFALAHNHPSGALAASPTDIEATEQIQKASATVGLRFVDHLIVAGPRWVSLRALGVLGDAV